jgi:acid phosphatase type 7
MTRFSPWAMLLSIAAASGVAEAQSLTRGPYLQQGGPTRITVRWRTSLATNSRVRYGPSTGALTSIKDDAASVTDHVVTLTGLSADTTYFYSVGSSAAALAGGDANHFFVTSPLVGTPKPTRVWVLGDAGTKDANQRAVRDAYLAFTGTRHTDLWLMLGDNAYTDGTDAEYQAAVYDMYPAMLRKSVLWSTFGNHEGHTSTSSTQSGPYYDMFTFPKSAEIGGAASGTEAYYAFDYANIHFVCLDSQGSSRSSTGTMANWLKADLASTSQDWLIVMWHHPPYTKGSHDSDSESALKEMRQNFNPILEGAGVDLVLCGHSHSYERSYLINGHYGLSSTFCAANKIDGGSGRDAAAYEKPNGLVAGKGAVYAVAGCSGKVSGGSLDHPAMYISLNQLGSMVLDVSGPRLDAKFLRETGVVADYFTLLKGTSSDATPPSLQITTPTSAATHATSTSPLSLGGTASDNVGVTRVTWSNAANGAAGTATGLGAWTASVPLAAGSNAITVRAEDAAGNFATDILTVTHAAADVVNPAISITAPTTASTHATSSTPLALGGTASDNVGVTQVTWSNAANGGTGTASGTTSWTASIALAAGSNAITVTAKDAAGNPATDTITVTYTPGDATAPLVSITTPTSAATHATSATPLALGGTASDNVGVTQVTWTNAGTGGTGTAAGTTSWTASIPLASGSNTITVRAEDAAGNFATDVVTVTYTPPAGDTTNPALTIVSPAANPFAATSEPLAVSGGATDDVAVATVTWSNAATGGSGTASGTTTWSASIPLAAGANAITITAVDTSGNRASAALSVTYGTLGGVGAGDGDGANGDHALNDKCAGSIAAPGWPPLWLLALLFFRARKP